MVAWSMQATLAMDSHSSEKVAKLAMQQWAMQQLAMQQLAMVGIEWDEWRQQQQHHLYPGETENLEWLHRWHHLLPRLCTCFL